MKKDKRNKEEKVEKNVEEKNESVEEIKEDTVVPTKENKFKKVFKFKNKTVVPKEKKGAEAITTKGKFNLNKKLVASICGAVAAVVVVVLIVVLVVNRDNSEETMNKKINDLGTQFYESFYYQSAGGSDEDDRDEFLGKFTDIGIKVSLENLVRYYVTTDDYKDIEGALEDDSTVSERVDALLKSWFKTDKYDCDKDNTKVIIYPQSPFGEKDYKIEVVTSCGFDSESTDEE